MSFVILLSEVLILPFTSHVSWSYPIIPVRLACLSELPRYLVRRCQNTRRGTWSGTAKYCSYLAVHDASATTRRRTVLLPACEPVDTPSRLSAFCAPCCRQHDELLGQVVLAMLAFSICVQMAEGLHFAVVPYVSKPAMGIVMGMVAAGGNLGAVVLLLTVFRNDNIERTDTGFMVLGGVRTHTARRSRPAAGKWAF
eukprot:5004859-Pleurochrysis_carterae.AAC.1